LEVVCELNPKKYAIGIKVTDEEMEKINIKKDEFHGEWNYIICPNIN
jgi:hypothetical protein